jgi:putative flavoprotein involved in K+ transport
LPGRRVLVVGGGNTGFQIAEELAVTREVHLAIGARQTPLPQRLLGRDLFDYLERLGLMGKERGNEARVTDAAPRVPDRLQPARHPPPRRAAARPRRRGLRLGGDVQRRRARVGRCGGVGDRFPRRPLVRRRAGVRRAPPGAAPPRRHRRSRPVFPRLQWQYTRGSALLGWVKDDAAHIAEQIAARQRTKPSETARWPTSRRPRPCCASTSPTTSGTALASGP